MLFRSRFIIGLNNPTTTTRQVFVYEVASGSVLRSRSVTSISSVLAVSADGSRFMAGLTLFDTATLTVIAQQNAANSTYLFPVNVNFNTQTNQGGSTEQSQLIAELTAPLLFSPTANIIQSQASGGSQGNNNDSQMNAFR